MKIPQTKRYSIYKKLVLQDKRSEKLNFESDGREHYVYRVTEIKKQEHYYGSRTSKQTDIILDFWKYGTSSKNKKIILENKEKYKTKIVKIFDNPGDKICYEAFLHQYFNVKLNKVFWNKSNQTPFGFDTTGIPSVFKKHSEESKAKMRGRKTTKEGRENISRATKGKKKPNLSNVMKGSAMYKNTSGEVLRLTKEDVRVTSGEYISVKKGILATNETKNKMSNARKGMKMPKEVGNKISETNGLNIKIYDAEDKEQYYCTNGFSKFCKENKIPLGIFKVSYQKETIINARTIKYKIYNGWYARIV